MLLDERWEHFCSAAGGECCPPPSMNMAATSNVETAVGRG